MELIRRTFKGKTRLADSEKFTVEATVSDESLDRYNEVILADAWKNGLKKYKTHPVLLSSHRYSDLTSQIGVGEKISVVDEELVSKFKYFVGEGNPQADWGFKLAEKGLAAFSVGFIPKSEMTDVELEEWSKRKKIKPRRVYKEVELLEISQVLIPANTNALQKCVEDEDPVVRGLAEAISKDADMSVLVEEDKGWEQTENEIRHRVRDPKLFEEGSFRYIPLKKSKPRVNAVIGKLLGEDKTTIQALRFPKSDGWTMDKAKSWVKTHPVKSFDVLLDLDDGVQMENVDSVVLYHEDGVVLGQHSLSTITVEEVRAIVEKAVQPLITMLEEQSEQLSALSPDEIGKQAPKDVDEPSDKNSSYIKEIFKGLGDVKSLLST